MWVRDPSIDVVNVPVRGSVTTAKITHDQAGVHPVMEETGKECGLFPRVYFGLCGPIWIWFFDPLEVIIGKVGDCLLELLEWSVSLSGV